MTPVRNSLVYIFFFITIESTSTNPLRTNDDYTDHKTCEVDGNCPKGTFCFKDIGECAPCVNCSSRFRQNGTLGCHQEAADCGECLPGYEEVRLERGLLKESCKPITAVSKNPTHLSRNGTTETMNDVPWFLAIVTILSTIFVAAFLISKWSRRRDVVQPQPAVTELQELVNHTSDPPPPPPPYSPYATVCHPPNIPAASAPVLESPILQVDSPKDCGTNICVQTQERFWNNEQDRLVQAKVCRPPNWVNNRFSTGIGSSPTHHHGDESEDEFDGQHDENTQPSSWTPVAQDAEATVAPSTEEMSVGDQLPQDVIGSTAVGTVSAAPSRTPNERDVTCFRRTSSIAENLSAATDQDNCSDELQQKKRMRSESPDPTSEQQWAPSELSLSQNNHNRSYFHLQQLQAPIISINFNVGRRDNVHSDSDDSPTAAALPDSGELVFHQPPNSSS